MSTKPTAPNVESEIKKDEQGLERLVFFSDAVFAIVVTLLALELRLPQGVEYGTESALRQALLDLIPGFLAYFIGFAVISLFWVGHHRKFRFIVRYDTVLIYLNLAILLTIAIVPFMSSLLSEYLYRTVVVLYAGTLLATSLLSALLNWYVLRRDMVDPAIPPEERDVFRLSAIKNAGVFLLSIVIAQWNPVLAMCSWILLAFTNVWHSSPVMPSKKQVLKGK